MAHRWSKPAAASPPTELAALTDEDNDAGGSHTAGRLTVAELIAKMGSPVAERPRHHHAVPDSEQLDAEPCDDGYNAYAEWAPADYDYDLSRLEDIQPGPADIEQTTLLPKVPAAPRPVRLVAHPRPNQPNRPSRMTSTKRTTELPAPKRRRHRGALMIAGRLTAATIAAAALAMTGGAWQWSTSKNHQLNTISALDPQSRDVVDPNAQFGDEDFLIVGMDSRAGANSSMGAGDTEDAGGARSDTIMLVNVPANRKRVVTVSFPRDLAITPIQCEAWNPDTGEYGPLYDADTKKWGSRLVYTETKLNSTFSFGGPKCLVKEIQKLSGLSINRFIAVDFSGFAKMVDAFGRRGGV